MNALLSVNDLSRMFDATFSNAASVSPTAHAAVMPEVPVEVANRFQALMSTAVPAPSAAQETSAVTKLVETTDTEIRKVLDNTEYLSQHANELSVNQMFAASLQAAAQATAMQIDLQAKMSVVTSTKDAIGSLMKNQ